MTGMPITVTALDGLRLAGEVHGPAEGIRWSSFMAAARAARHGEAPRGG